MTTRVQVIERDGEPAFYVVPADLWSVVREAIEDAEDAAAYAAAIAADDGVTYPTAVAHAMMDGAHPVRAWRAHRGLTLQALADKAGVSKPYVSQIEGGKRAGTAATIKKLARALGVSMDALQV
jgi:antitoxin component HigA of HigAB toxin-antitoxin module